MSVPIPTAAPGDHHVQAAFAVTLVDEWVRAGVTRAVLCPGSRSTPLAVALAGHPGLSVHVRLDERSAGFSALGIGLASGHPAVVVTTSGTAAAELHPAVVEADLARVPMIVCTADRPPELLDVGAPQTIDQSRLYGRATRWFSDPGVPVEATRSSWRSLAARSVVEACSGPGGPGPVHLNLPFREPLLGDAPTGGGLPPGRPGGRPWHSVVSGAVNPAEGALADLVGSGVVAPITEGVIVAGSGCGDPAAVLALAAALGWPVLAEPRSGLRVADAAVIGSADGILRSGPFAAAHRPRTVLRLGQRWVSKVVNGFLSAAVGAGAHQVVVEPWGGWSDPEREVATVLRCDPTLFARGMVALLGRTDAPDAERADRPGWLGDWVRAESAARSALDRLLPCAGEGLLDEPLVARCLFDDLPDAATVVVSSSMPVRDLEAFAGPRSRPPRVLANRGANGIDGVVSTALGVSWTGPTETVVLVGDLAFLHDVSALVRSGQPAAPLTVVVVDNHGGGIFSFLDPARSLDPETFDRLFATPQITDVADVARGFGLPVVDLAVGSTTGDLRRALADSREEPGLSVVCVRLPAPSENVSLHAGINQEIVAAVERVAP